MELEIERFLAESSYSDQTVATYRRDLGEFGKWLDSDKLDLATLGVATVKVWLKERGLSKNSQHIKAASIRAYCLWCYGEGHKLSGLKIIPEDPGPQRTLTADEVAILLSSLKGGNLSNVRNMALVTVMLDCGLRASEICALQLANVDLSERLLSVRVKGGKFAYKDFGEKTGRALADWLSIRDKVVMPGVSNLFVAIGSANVGKPLTPAGLRIILKAVARSADIPHFGPHALRRSMATLAILNGAPTRLVQAQGGWSSVALVERYTKQLQARDFRGYGPVDKMADF